MTEVMMAGDKLVDMWNRGDTEKDSCVDRERESLPRKKLSHSIEEILRRPTCVRKEKRVHRNWSVIEENTRKSNQHLCAGMYVLTFQRDFIFIKNMITKFMLMMDCISLSIEIPQMRILESPKATTDHMSEYKVILYTLYNKGT